MKAFRTSGGAKPQLTLHDNLGLKVSPGVESPILMRGSGIAVGAGMEAAAIGVEAPSKRQIGALVPAEDVTGRIFKDLHLHMGRRLQKISVL